MSPAFEIALQLFTAIGGAAGLGTMLKLGIDKRRASAEADHAEADADRAEADATKVVTDTAIGLLGPIKDQIAFLHTQLRAANAEIRTLGEYVVTLIGVIQVAGLQVPPRPESPLPPPTPIPDPAPS